MLVNVKQYQLLLLPLKVKFSLLSNTFVNYDLDQKKYIIPSRKSEHKTCNFKVQYFKFMKQKYKYIHFENDFEN